MRPLKKKPLPSAIDEELDQLYIDRCKHGQLTIDPVMYDRVQVNLDMLKISQSYNPPTEGEQS